MQYFDEEQSTMKFPDIQSSTTDCTIGPHHHQAVAAASASIACCQMFAHQNFHQGDGVTFNRPWYTIPAASSWQGQSSTSSTGKPKANLILDLPWLIRSTTGDASDKFSGVAVAVRWNTLSQLFNDYCYTLVADSKLCQFKDLELGRFKVIQGQRALCQSKALGWFPIWPPLSPTSYLSPFSRYLTLKIIFHRSNGEHNSTSDLAERNISDFHQKQYVTTSPGTLPWWQVWWRSVEDYDL